MKKVRDHVEDKYSQEIKNIDDIIKKATRSSRPSVNEAIEDLLEAGGKRIRPLLLISSWELGESSEDRESILPLGAALEILHMATLVHDDIIDRAYKRRGVLTTGQKFGFERALFVGDFLLSRAYNMFHKHLSPEKFMRLDKILQATCEGEIKEFDCRHDLDTSLLDYLRQIRRKTALLFGFSTYIGGYEGGMEKKNLKFIYRFGIQLGMAFQIQDDLLDFVGNPGEMGKSVGSDLANGVYSLPVQLILQDDEYGKQARKIIKQERIDKKNFQRLKDMMVNAGIIARVEQWVERYSARAEKAAENLPKNSSSADLLFFLEIMRARNS